MWRSAYAQARRPYCYGGKGYALCAGNPAIGYADACRSPSQWPCFDCSGLTYMAYLEGANTVIGHGTANQQNYPSVHASDLQPGDLMLFGGMHQHGRGAFITHVGVYVGDVTGDGTGDLIHAASYPDGVIVTNNVLGNTWYRNIWRSSRGHRCRRSADACALLSPPRGRACYSCPSSFQRACAMSSRYDHPAAAGVDGQGAPVALLRAARGGCRRGDPTPSSHDAAGQAVAGPLPGTDRVYARGQLADGPGAHIEPTTASGGAAPGRDSGSGTDGAADRRWRPAVS